MGCDPQDLQWVLHFNGRVRAGAPVLSGSDQVMRLVGLLRNHPDVLSEESKGAGKALSSVAGPTDFSQRFL